MYRFERFYTLLFFPWIGSIIIVLWHWVDEWSIKTQRQRSSQFSVWMVWQRNSRSEGLLWLKLSAVRGAVLSISGEQTKLLTLVSLQTLLSRHSWRDSRRTSFAKTCSTNISFSKEWLATQCNALLLVLWLGLWFYRLVGKSQYIKIEELSKLEVAPPFGARGLDLGYSNSGSGALKVVPEDLFESEDLATTNMVKCVDLEEPFLVPNDYHSHHIELVKDFYGLKVVQPPYPTDNHMAVTHWLINLVNAVFSFVKLLIWLMTMTTEWFTKNEIVKRNCNNRKLYWRDYF